MQKTAPKLPLTPEERKHLRTAKLTLKDVATQDVHRIEQALQVSAARARYLRALAEFQTIPSIGPKVAQGVVSLGYYSLAEIKNEDGADLINRYEALTGYWNDPCLEDCFRCIVHHANHPDSEKSWFDFTAERKSYRAAHGYPATRPTIPWYEGKKNRI